MNLWNQLGYSDNPYSPKPIKGNKQGEALLIGRDVEMRQLTRYITSSDTHTTIEGPNGVGKTSLVAVACYKLHQNWLMGESQQALIPIEEPFQLTTEDKAVDFKRKVLFQAAQALITHNDTLKKRGYNVPIVDDVNKWLNAPIFVGNSGGVSAFGLGGVSGGHTSSPNSSSGFSEDGFAVTICRWLRDCFPTSTAGGFICLIDNMELLNSSKEARGLLETMRDDVLSITGIRWVLSGARGIVRSAASSPRLQGVLAEPIDIYPLPAEHLEPVLSTRLSEFKIHEDGYAPVEADGLRHLYAVGNNNLRNAMKYCEDFSFWLSEKYPTTLSAKEKYDLLEVWMAELSEKHLKESMGVRPRAWEVFDSLVSLGGSTSPSEFESFGFESNQALRPHLRALEEANMIDSAIDETDKRRKTISVTPRGWIVNYARSGFQDLGKG